MSTSARLLLLSVLVAIGAVAAYPLLFRVAIIRNHPEGYVIAFALATALAALGVARAQRRVGPPGSSSASPVFFSSRGRGSTSSPPACPPRPPLFTWARSGHRG